MDKFVKEIDKLDRYAREQSKTTGFPITRSQALRRLVEIGLDSRDPRGDKAPPSARESAATPGPEETHEEGQDLEADRTANSGV